MRLRRKQPRKVEAVSDERIHATLDLIQSVQPDRPDFASRSTDDQPLTEQLWVYVLQLLAGTEPISRTADHRLVCYYWQWLCDDSSVLSSTLTGWKYRHSVLPKQIQTTGATQLQAWSDRFPEPKDVGEEDMDPASSTSLRATDPIRLRSRGAKLLCENTNEMIRIPRTLAAALLCVLKKQELIKPGVRPQQALASLCKPEQRVLVRGVLQASLPLPKRIEQLSNDLYWEAGGAFSALLRSSNGGKRKGRRYRGLQSETRLRKRWLKIGVWLSSAAARDCLEVCAGMEVNTKLKPLLEWIECVASVSLQLNQARRTMFDAKVLELRQLTHTPACLVWIEDRVEGAAARRQVCFGEMYELVVVMNGLVLPS